MSEDYSYLEIQSVTTNTFVLTVANSGGSSGTEGAYVVAFKAAITTNVTAGDIDSVTITMPSAALEASQQLESINISSDAQETVMVLTVPRGIESGAAGAATSLINYNYPVVRGVIGNNQPSFVNMAAFITSTNVNANNFNIFNILGSDEAVGDASTIKVLF
jgi:hypothetical protein